MCIIAYKPMGVEFPNKKTIKRMFEANSDGAGLMVADGKKVTISKGYMTFKEFWKALKIYREEFGDDKAYVLHFRISTQGGIRQDCCHPFPLSPSMDAMRWLDCESDIGVAHNGIISMCSTYSGYSFKSKTIDYSDTMEFITEYLSLIIKNRDYYKDKDTLKLIEKLCGSRLAILDASGHCEVLGTGWIEDNGIYYSNNSYKEYTFKSVITTTPTISYKDSKAVYGWSDYDENDDDSEWFDDKSEWDSIFDSYIDDESGLYDFSPSDCPITITGDPTYCGLCLQCDECYGCGSEVAI